MMQKKERLTFGLLAVFSVLVLGFILLKLPPSFTLSLASLSIPIVLFFLLFLFLFILSIGGLFLKNDALAILAAGFTTSIALFRFFYITHWFFFLLLILFFGLLTAFFYQKK